MQPLHDYQKEVVEKIIKDFETYDSVMLQMPTGTGKTLVFCEVLRRFRENSFENLNENGANRRILILVHKEHLIEQTINSLNKVFKASSNDYIGTIRSGNKRNTYPSTLIAMVQTLANDINNKNKQKKHREIPEKVSLVIIDEAHHSIAESWKTIIKHYKKQGAKFLGVTATPKRLDGNGFENEYEKLIQSYSLRWFIETGYLAKYRHYATAEPNLKNIREIANDFAQNILSKRMTDKKIMAEVIKSYFDYGNHGKAIVFAVNKTHAKQLKERFEAEGIQCGYIHSHTKKSERENIKKEFENGIIKVLCNVNIFTEGFDCRDADVAILARPTKSLVLYLQMIGRILRRDQNNQSKTALILDNAMLWKEHGLVSMDREWFLRGGGDIEDDFESYVDENKEVKLRKRKRNPIKEDKNLELQEIDSIVNNNKKKSKRIHVKKFQFTLQFLTKNKIIHEEHIYVKKLPDETKRIENKLGKLTKEKQYDEVVIKTNNNHFIHWKKKKKWMDWKKDTFKYVLIQDSKDRYIWELPKNYLPSSNEKELPLAKVYDNVMAAFTSKLAVQFYNGHVHFTNILFDKPFFISFESPYFCIDFSKFDISFPYKYYKTNIIEGKKRYSNKQSFIEATNQIKRWLEIIDMDH